MKIHEYQAKEILRRYGVVTPRGKVTEDPKEARRICEELGGRCVVKAQIHAGGRARAAASSFAHSPEMARDLARQILGMQFVTHQRGLRDSSSARCFEEMASITKELYQVLSGDGRKS